MCYANSTELSDDLRMVHVALSLILALAGTFGNVLSVILICKTQMLRAAPTMMLIIDLCLANLVSTVFVMPVIAASSFYKHWPIGEVFCEIFAYVMYAALTSECFILMNITIGQYLVIVHRVSNKIMLNHHRCVRLAALLGLPWVLSLAAFLVPLTQTWDRFGYDPKKGYCSILSKEENIGFLTVGAIVVIATMTVVTFYCYTAIFFVHYVSHRKITPSVKDTVARSNNHTRNAQLIKMITVILINYLVTYLPFLITSVADPCLRSTPSSLYTIIVYTSWSHAATNPVIYALLNTRINAMYCNFFACCRSKSASKVTSIEVLNDITERNIEIISTI